MSDTVLKDCADDISYLQVNYSVEYLNIIYFFIDFIRREFQSSKLFKRKKSFTNTSTIIDS